MILNTRIDFNVNQLPIALNNTMTILGIKINNNLDWTDQIHSLVKKANQRLHILRILKQHTTDEELHNIYLGLMRSVLEYASPLFVGLNMTLDTKLQRVANRAHKLIYGASSCYKCGTLRERRMNASLKLFRKIESNSHHILHNKIPEKLFTRKMGIRVKIQIRST